MGVLFCRCKKRKGGGKGEEEEEKEEEEEEEEEKLRRCKQRKGREVNEASGRLEITLADHGKYNRPGFHFEAANHYASCHPRP